MTKEARHRIKKHILKYLNRKTRKGACDITNQEIADYLKSIQLPVDIPVSSVNNFLHEIQKEGLFTLDMSGRKTRIIPNRVI